MKTYGINLLWDNIDLAERGKRGDDNPADAKTLAQKLLQIPDYRPVRDKVSRQRGRRGRRKASRAVGYASKMRSLELFIDGFICGVVSTISVPWSIHRQFVLVRCNSYSACRRMAFRCALLFTLFRTIWICFEGVRLGPFRCLSLRDSLIRLFW